MTFPHIVDVCLRRQRIVFFTTLVLALGALVALTFSLPKVYEATATIAVGNPSSAGTEVARTDELQTLARTYAELLQTSEISRAVVRSLPFNTSRGRLQGSTSFEAVAGTQLLRVRAQDESPQRARLIANAYATTLIEHQRNEAAAAAQRAIGELNGRIQDRVNLIGRLELRRDARSLAALQAARQELAATIGSHRAIQENLLRRQEEVSIVSRAATPNSPVKPRPSLYLSVGAVLALILAIMATLLRDSFDNRIRHEDEVADLVGAPVLARVPNVRRASAALLGDSFQLLRSNLLLADARGNQQVLAVVSSNAREGKSTVVSELASAIGLTEAPVIAVDCDLRRPTLHHMLGGVELDSGLSDLLATRTDGIGIGASNVDTIDMETTARYIKSTDRPNVRLLPAGSAAVNPPVLLSSRRFTPLLAGLCNVADFIVIDTPPVTLAADASLVASAADAVLLVVDLQRTRRSALRATVDQLRNAGAPLVGIVINRATRNRSHDYYTALPDAAPTARRPEAAAAARETRT